MSTATPTHQTAAEHAAHARISRLRAAIGEGPHSFTFRPNDHLGAVLSAIGDTVGLTLLEQEKRR